MKNIIYYLLFFAALLWGNTGITKVYFYTDSQGVTHFTDSTEDAEEDGYTVTEYEDLDEDHEDEVLLSYNALTQEVMIENQLYSPISVILKATNEDTIETDIKFDEIFTVEANTTKSLGHIYSFDSTADFSLTRQFSIGTPTAINKSDTGELQIPFRGKFRVTQANGGTNYIRLRHDDGTMTVYVHLKPNSERVKLGDYVGGGEQIAESGNTGYTSGPHLHFAVQRNNGIATVSIPFKFYGTLEPKIGMWISN